LKLNIDGLQLVFIRYKKQGPLGFTGLYFSSTVHHFIPFGAVLKEYRFLGIQTNQQCSWRISKKSEATQGTKTIYLGLITDRHKLSKIW